MTVSSLLFNNPVFKDALAEIEGLGFRVSDRSTPGTIPYGIIGGRSNQRWWLVPLNDRRLTVSGLALFQPIVSSAKVLKSAAVMASTLGLSSVWLREKVYISGRSYLEEIFSEKGLCFAFFTGTDSPHRKVAVQIMARDGRIKGFAKVSQNSSVKPLLKHEAQTLEYLNTLDLQAALIPEVLFCGEIGIAEVLVTDSLKTARTKTVTALNDAHISFLQELADKTAIPVEEGDVPLATSLRKRYVAAAECLTNEWQNRFEKALEVIEGAEGELGCSKRLTHGDFTPWNTFFVDGRLYVFDWEYASKECQVGHDLIHFVLSLPSVKRWRVSETIREAKKVMRESKFFSDDANPDCLFLSYLCANSLHYIGRVPKANGQIIHWDGEQEAAVCLDSLNGRSE